ncbi:MAG: hypothetical protein LBG97_00945 [Coriobacteriales bacterium]|jgi:hypothetical protein|nr:hypothetical protein [Coriobacteriales bacterium]
MVSGSAWNQEHLPLFSYALVIALKTQFEQNKTCSHAEQLPSIFGGTKLTMASIVAECSSNICLIGTLIYVIFQKRK